MEENRGRRRKKGRGRRFLLFLARLSAAVAAALFVILYVFFRIPAAGGSMEPAVSGGDFVFVCRIAYLFHAPERYDVVAFRDNGGISLKRIVGLPGETVTIADGKIFINGTEQPEESAYLKNIDVAGRAGGSGVALGEDDYFVLGDNPSRSQDSRSETPGNVSRSDIIGDAWLSVDTSDLLPSFHLLIP